jgi:hypothetical protein
VSLLMIAAKSAGVTLVSLEMGRAMLTAARSAMDIRCLISNLTFAPASIRRFSFS